MFSLGDKVRFLNEPLNGVVTRLIDHQQVAVTTTDGFEIPVHIKEIVPVSTEEKKIWGNNEVETQPSKASVEIPEIGLYLAFQEQTSSSGLLRLNLINNINYDILISFFTESSGVYKGVASEKVQKKSSLTLSYFNLTDFEKWPVFHFHVLFYKQDVFSPRQPFIKAMRFKASTFFKSLRNAPLTGEKVYLFQLDGEDMKIDPDYLKEKISKSDIPASGVFVPEREVDLHIEELTDQFPHMSAPEMLSFQLNYFSKCLESAIAHNFDRIIFIHGVGNGVLRTEIHKKVSKHPHVKTFKDAQKEKFGYGATEVILK